MFTHFCRVKTCRNFGSFLEKSLFNRAPRGHSMQNVMQQGAVSILTIN